MFAVGFEHDRVVLAALDKHDASDREVHPGGGEADESADLEIVEWNRIEQALDGVTRDSQAREQNQRAFEAAIEVLNLLVAIGMRRVGGPR